MFLHAVKKMLAFIGMAVAIGIVMITSLKAQDVNTTTTTTVLTPDTGSSTTPPPAGTTDGSPPLISGIGQCKDQLTCLMAITQNTYGALQVINTLPTYLYNLSQMAISWMAPDDSQAMQDMQFGFASFGKAVVKDSDDQNAMQQQLTVDLLNQSSATNPPQIPFSVADFNAERPRSNSGVPINLNDFIYSTMLGIPPIPKTATQASPYNFVKYASGFSIPHTIPNLSWNARSKDDVARYLSYYTTVMAVESFNGYVLSSQYADLKNNPSGGLTAMQNALITQASSSSWLANIATEKLGLVLRQLLMFESQSYVLLSQLVQTQKQLLTAQVMTNSLMILNSQNTESLLLSRAQGVRTI